MMPCFAMLAFDVFAAAICSWLARDAASSIFRAGPAGGTERTDSNAAVLARWTLETFSLCGIRLSTGRTGLARFAVHAELIAPAGVAERGVVLEPALAP